MSISEIETQTEECTRCVGTGVEPVEVDGPHMDRDGLPLDVPWVQRVPGDPLPVVLVACMAATTGGAWMLTGSPTVMVGTGVVSLVAAAVVDWRAGRS